MPSEMDDNGEFSLISSPWLHQWQFHLMATLTIICFSLYCTRLVTAMKLERVLHSDSKTKEAPTVPYTIPVVGHAFSMGSDIVRFNFDIAYVTPQKPV